MSEHGETQGLSAQEIAFRRVMRSPLEELVAHLTGSPHHYGGAYTYTELVQRAHNLLGNELERISPLDSENESADPTEEPTDVEP